MINPASAPGRKRWRQSRVGHRRHRLASERGEEIGSFSRGFAALMKEADLYVDEKGKSHEAYAFVTSALQRPRCARCAVPEWSGAFLSRQEEDALWRAMFTPSSRLIILPNT